MDIRRILKMDLPPGQSAFLWGPRKTGKTTYLRTVFPKSPVFDFLQTDLLLEFSKNPSRLRETLLAQEPAAFPVILDEVQKVPLLLDEVHWLIENKKMSFILCGSSARKLKRGQANLLGGRAWRFEMFPLVSAELKEFSLLRILNHGAIPSHYLQENPEKSLTSYLQDYLKEEVFAEGLTRNLAAFSRFFDAVGFSHGQLVNYSNIARDCGVDAKTVREYFQILIDTLVGVMLEPFKKRKNRQVITKAPKFYLFDVGVAGALVKRRLAEERGSEFGRAFEHFILTELLAHRSYSELHYEISFWRTKSGLEVNFVLGGGEVAVEVKGSGSLAPGDLRPLQGFVEEFSPREAILVCLEKRERMAGKIRVMPWRIFLEKLWGNRILK